MERGHDHEFGLKRKAGAREGKAQSRSRCQRPIATFTNSSTRCPPRKSRSSKQVRAFMETKVAPIINKYWSEDSFPFELFPAIKELSIGGLGMQGYGCRGGSELCLDWSPWRWPASIHRSRRSSAFTTAWRWARSTSVAPKSKSRSGCRRWPASRRLAVSV